MSEPTVDQRRAWTTFILRRLQVRWWNLQTRGGDPVAKFGNAAKGGKAGAKVVGKPSKTEGRSGAKK